MVQTKLGSGGGIGVLWNVIKYEQDFIFESAKFENQFGIAATSPDEELRKLVESLKK